MKAITVHLYQFDELDDEAKDIARAWFKTDYPDHDWWKQMYEDAKQVATRLGIEIDKIYFSDFWSQGDDACFTGTFRSADLIKTTEKHFKNEYPTEKGLHILLRRLQAVKHQKRAFLEIITQRRYSHSDTMEIEDPNCYYVWTETYEILSCLRKFADWIYANLKKEHDYLCSDEYVDENIRINEYWFLQSGERNTLGDD